MAMIVAIALALGGIMLGVADALLNAAMKRERGRRLAGIAISRFAK